jgi:hypothetical protein
MRLGERARQSICFSNRMDSEPGQPEAELVKNGDGGGDLSRPGLLRCRGGGPREAVEDEGLLVLLGGRSVRTKGSTGARSDVAHRGRGGKEERGGVSSARGEGEKMVGPVTRRHVEEESVGGGGWQPERCATGGGSGRTGVCHVKQGSGWHAWAAREGVGQPRKRRELGRAREKQCGF